MEFLELPVAFYLIVLSASPERQTLGPLLQIQSSEEGLLYIQSLARTFRDVCCWWVGPWHPVIRIFHPAFIKPVVLAPGRHHVGSSLHNLDPQVHSTPEELW